MSVLSKNRTVSRAEFVNKANEIYVETIRFLTRVSSRYARLLAQPIADLAGEVVDNCEKANSIFPRGDMKKEMREKYLIEARASLHALDVRMSHLYQIMMWNPQGCFEDTNIKTKNSTDAVRRLDKMAEKLGCLIDDEDKLIQGVIASDKTR